MQEKWLYGIIGLLAGILITVLTASNVVNSGNQGMMRMMGMQTNREMIGNIDDLQSLEDL